MRKIMENQLTRMKIPLKIAVVEDAELLKVSGWEYSDGLYNLHSNQIKIYAEGVKSVERKLSRDEINELIQVIAAANFLDLWPANIVLAEDGVYFIDTEFKSFAGSICWGKMGRFESLIDEEDRAYFKEKVEGKMNEPEEIKENNGYGHLKTAVVFSKFLQPSLTEEIENRISNLEYVGAKAAGGSWLKPNNFSFNLKDVLT